MERFNREGGLDYFDDVDTLRLLLDMARCPGDRENLVRNLLDEFGSVKGIFEARDEQLRKVDGIGGRTATMIRMVLPIARQWERLAMHEPDKICNTNEASLYCKSLLLGLRVEQFHVICLNARCYIIGSRKISDGTLTEVSSYPRIVMETALNYNAHSVLFCHNHPGGTNYPSGEDITSTLKLQQMLAGVGIMVLDHIIVSGNNTYSMIQQGDITYRVVSKS